VHSLQAFRRSRGIAPFISDHWTKWRWVVSFVPKLLYLWGNNSWCPLNRRLGAVAYPWIFWGGGSMGGGGW
jgi:hypothetical protein